jgi:hypothetical protein
MRAEQRPQSNCSDVSAFFTKFAGSLPKLLQPSDLLFARAAVTRFGHRNRNVISLPSSPQKSLWASSAFGPYARREHIRISVDVFVPCESAGYA